jgi:UrcA family protein
MRPSQSSALFAASASAVIFLASSAVAEGLRVPVGDLSQPSAARDFDQRLNAAAHRLCSQRYRPVELDAEAACVAAARSEGLDQLSSAQREALAEHLPARSALASLTR